MYLLLNTSYKKNMNKTWKEVERDNPVAHGFITMSMIFGGVLLGFWTPMSCSLLVRSHNISKGLMAVLIPAVLGIVLLGIGIYGLNTLKKSRKKISKSSYDLLYSIDLYQAMIAVYLEFANMINDSNDRENLKKYGHTLQSRINWYLSKVMSTPIALTPPKTSRVVYASAIANALAGPVVGLGAAITEAGKVAKEQIEYEQNKRDILEHNITVANINSELNHAFSESLKILSRYKEICEKWNSIVESIEKKYNDEYVVSDI